SSATAHPPRAPLCPYTTLFRSFGNQRAAGTTQPEALGQIPVHFLDEHAQPTPGHGAFVTELAEHIHGIVNGNGKRYTHETTGPRSEEHTSELQSRENLVCRPPL